MPRTIVVTVADDFPEEVLALLKATPLEVDSLDLLPVLAARVGLIGERIHGFDEREDLDKIAEAESLLVEALNCTRAIDILRRQEIAEEKERCGLRAVGA